MKIKLFITDDHGVFRSGLKALLELDPNYTVLGDTDNGLDTIKAVNKLDVDVLLLDLSLPDIHGSRVAEELLKKNKHLLIVVLTMHDDEHYLKELFRIGAKGYVLKQSSGETVKQAIDAVCEGGMFIDPSLASAVLNPYIGENINEQKKTRVSILTPREKEILPFLANGHTNVEIGEMLSISDRTVETHRLNIMRKLELKNRASIVKFARDNDMLT